MPALFTSFFIFFCRSSVESRPLSGSSIRPLVMEANYGAGLSYIYLLGFREYSVRPPSSGFTQLFPRKSSSNFAFGITPDDLTFLSSLFLTDAPFSRASCCITDPSISSAIRNQKLGTFTRVTSGDSFRIPEIRRRGEVRMRENMFQKKICKGVLKS